MDLGWPHCFIGHSLLLCSYYHMVRNLLETGYICHQDWWDCGVPSPVEWELPKVGETDSALKFLSFFMSMSHYSIKYLPLSLSPCPSVSFIICPCIYLSFFLIFHFFAVLLLTRTPQQLVSWIYCHCFVVRFSSCGGRENSWRRKIGFFWSCKSWTMNSGWPWAARVTSQKFSFLICKMIMSAISPDWVAKNIK